MSEAHSNQEPSFTLTGEQLSRQGTNADKAIDSAEFSQQYELHDYKHWHAAYRVPDCRSGFPDFKVGPSCSTSGYKNVLEEPLCRSRSLASKRLDSVAMFPSLLSNLTVSRTHSDPCIFGKDYLRITLPLPGEPSDCGLSAEGLGYSAFKNMVANESPGLIGVGTRDDNFVLEASTSSSIRMPETATRTVRSENDCLFFEQNSESIGIGVNKEHVLAPEMVGFRDETETSQSFRVGLYGKTPPEVIPGLNKWSLGEFVDTAFDETAASGPWQGASNSCRISARTPHWDDWTCQSKELGVSSLSRQVGNKSNNCYLASGEDTRIDRADEEGSDKGYLVLEELDRQQRGRLDDEDDACGADDEESISSTELSTSEEEEVFKDGGPDTDNNSKGYKEDDIWADEHFVSSQVKGFPPPISILANETHPGLPGHMPRTLWRSVKRDGRFVLQEVQAQPREFFRATREFGRLRLQLVRPDSDPVRKYRKAVDMCIEDPAEADSIASERTTQNLSHVPDSYKTGNYQDIDEGFSTATHSQRPGSLQPEGLRTVENNINSEGTLDELGSMLVQELVSSTSLPMECGTVLKEERASVFSSCAEMCGVSLSQDAGCKEFSGLGGGDVMIGVPCVTNHCLITLDFPGGFRELLAETTNQSVALESRASVSDISEAAKPSEIVIDNREQPVSFCPSDGVQEIRLGPGHNAIVGQIDEEQKGERMGVENLTTEVEVGQAEKLGGLGSCNHSNAMTSPTVHRHEEQFRQDYKHPCFNTTYGFDNNHVLSPSQAFMQFPIQPAVR